MSERNGGMADGEHSLAEGPLLSEQEDLSIAQQLANVAIAMSDLVRELQLNRPDVQTIRRRSGWQLVAALALVAACAGLGLLAWGNRNLTIAVTEQNAIIGDCINPAGRCYQDSRSRTGEVEKRILTDQANRSNGILAAVCSFIDQHGLDLPVECGPVIPPGGTTPR